MNRRVVHPRPIAPARRGTVYVAVLSTSLLVVVIGLGGLIGARVLSRTMDSGAQAAAAQWYAESAIEVARAMIDQDSSWRTTHGNGEWLSDVPIGDGTMSVDVTNPSGALDRASTDAVVITGTGTSGSATRVVTVTMKADSTVCTCLGVSMCAGGAMNLGSSTVNPAGNRISSNTSVVATLGIIGPDVESAGLVTGTTYSGTQTSLAKARTLPDSSVFDYYIANGTSIPIASIPQSAGTYEITACVLSPANNPFSGGTNAQGIYVIDCQGQALQFTGCRIVGTIVVLNALSCASQTVVCWEPAVSNYPCLMVRGNFQFKNNGNPLIESNSAKVTYNPAGTPYPYPGGTSNATYTDSFPCKMLGLLYVSGNLTTNSNPSANMIMVGGTVTSTGTLTLAYDGTFASSPPPGFASVIMRPQLGTFVRKTN